MNYLFRSILLGLILQLTLPVHCQEYRIENITSEYIRIEKGLSQNSANTIIQDREGFLWIGTWNGLNRFDGYSFRIFSRNPASPATSLTHSTVIGLTEDTLGYIWAACTKGLNRIGKNDLTVTQFTTDNSRSRGMVADSITSLFHDRSGLIWIGTNRGVMTLDPSTLQFNFIEHNPRDFTTISSNQVSSICEDSSGFIWIGTRNGLNRLNVKTGQVIRHFAGQQPGELVSSAITCMVPGNDNDLWIGTPAGLQRYSTRSRSFSLFPNTVQVAKPELSFPNNITALYLDKKKSLWVGTRESGLFLLNPPGYQFINLQERIPESEYFRFNSFNSIIQDRNGLYWIGTSHKGIIKLIPDPHAFYEIMSSFSVFGIIEPYPDQLWFGTRDGILVWDRIKKTSRLLKANNFKTNNLTSNLINGLIDDGQYIWVMTEEGVNRIRKDNLSNRKFIPDGSGNSIAGSNVWHVMMDSMGNYWFATTSGLSCWNPETDRFTNYYHDPQNHNSLSNNSCYQVYEVKPGTFLISTQYGLNEFIPSSGQWKVFLPVKGDMTSISTEYIFGIFKDLQGDLWVYTNGGGFNSFNPETGTFERYTTTDGLSDNTVYGIHEDRDGIFWLPTNSGLSRFDPRDERFATFNVQEGLLSNEFNLNSIYSTENGEVYLGGINGTNAFMPQTTLRTSITPMLSLTEFIVHGNLGSFEIPIMDTLRLKSSGNTFSISFSILDFLNPFKNQYTCYLENFDKDITRLSPGIQQVDYRKIPPGHYVFRVRGSNSLGIESPELAVPIIIVPAWYQTFWFKILTVMLVIIFGGSLIVIRLISLRNKHEIEKQLLTTQTELVRSQKFALRSQMNPHFIFNSLNSIQNFVLKNDVDSANYYLSNFSSLMRKVLEFSQYNFILLAEEMELINLYLKMEHMRFSKKFEIDIRVDPSIDQYLVRIPPMLMQPYLENAILHGLQLIKHKGLLQVLVEDHEDHMQINIIDNGIGRQRARAIREKTGHKSKGLANIEKRIQLYNKISDKNLEVKIIDLFSESGEPSGTRVEIIVPYEMDEPSAEIF